MHNPYDLVLITDDDAAHRSRIPPSLGGDDFAYGSGSPIIAPADGIIDLADDGPGGSGGRMIGVNHGDGIHSEQLHASRLLLGIGAEVDEGDTIALSGGSAFGDEHGVGFHIHAHFVVNGTRHGWVNFLASQGALTGLDDDPITLEDDMDIRIIFDPTTDPRRQFATNATTGKRTANPLTPTQATFLKRYLRNRAVFNDDLANLPRGEAPGETVLLLAEYDMHVAPVLREIGP
jgi:murein DD-endopeptidase MepM/ murein hydrolase activator NlpD